MLSTLHVYSSEAWTAYTRYEKKLNSFHLNYLRCILRSQGQDKDPNLEVLLRANMNSMWSILNERPWLGHVKRVGKNRISKDLLYGKLSEGALPTGQPHLRYEGVCKKGHEGSQRQHRGLGEVY